MAGDWLKIEEDTPEKPEILAMASFLNLDPEIVFAKCFKFWRWAARNSADGTVRFLSASEVDKLFGLPGFSDALLSVSWLQARSDSLVIPNFDRHMSQSAKKRALDTARKREVRKPSAKNPKTQPVRDLSAFETDKNGTIEEKRREESKEESPLPPSQPQEQKRRSVFHKPTVEEVASYCRERGNSVDPQKFWDFYESKNWMVGKNKMTDWKAAIRSTWEKPNGQAKTQNGTEELGRVRGTLDLQAIDRKTIRTDSSEAQEGGGEGLFT